MAPDGSGCAAGARHWNRGCRSEPACSATARCAGRSPGRIGPSRSAEGRAGAILSATPSVSTSDEKRPSCGFHRSVWQPSDDMSVASDAGQPVAPVLRIGNDACRARLQPRIGLELPVQLRADVEPHAKPGRPGFGKTRAERVVARRTRIRAGDARSRASGRPACPSASSSTAAGAMGRDRYRVDPVRLVKLASARRAGTPNVRRGRNAARAARAAPCWGG